MNWSLFRKASPESGLHAAFVLLGAVLLLSSCDNAPSDTTAEDPLAGMPVHEFSVSEDDVVIGDPSAPVTIIEYGNFSCSHCATFHRDTFPLIRENFVDTGKVQFVFREFTGDGPGVYGAMLARCAGPDRYWAFADLLFETQDAWAYTENFATDLAAIAASRGVGKEAFETCLKDEELFASLMARGKVAADTYELTGTPGFLVNGKIVPGAVTYETFETILNVALAEAGAE